MSNILLVEPNYRAKFPPLGLMRLSTYHKAKGDCVTFIRGLDPEKRDSNWHRIYISSLFTWELQRTVNTIQYYSNSINDPKNIFVGGIGATLLPDFIKKQTPCTLIEGQIDKPGMIEEQSPSIAELIPDYTILENVDYAYDPKDAYFARLTKGCVRNCKFCAVPHLEPEFGMVQSLAKQISQIESAHGEKQNLVLLDNNILALENIEEHLSSIAGIGFSKGAMLNKRLRTVDFNQGIDARIIAERPSLAKALGKLAMKPVRLAFDFLSPAMERYYRRAIALLATEGFNSFTTYILYNHLDTPSDFYRRLQINLELNIANNIRISGFPMRYIPITDTKRGYISSKWQWRWLRGIQCVLQATRGIVSPNPDFFEAAFGKNEKDFFQILSMPDRYIIYRDYYKNNGADEWKTKFQRLSQSSCLEFLEVLQEIHFSSNKKACISKQKKFRSLIEHYYPNGAVPSATTIG